jgi:hypothetical protein
VSGLAVANAFFVPNCIFRKARHGEGQFWVKVRRTQYEYMSFRYAPRSRTWLDAVGMSQTCNSRSGPLYSMISSALSRTDVGSVTLSARAALRFTTSLKRTGRSTGNSAGAAPCRTLRVIAPACMNRL